MRQVFQTPPQGPSQGVPKGLPPRPHDSSMFARNMQCPNRRLVSGWVEADSIRGADEPCFLALLRIDWYQTGLIGGLYGQCWRV